MQVLITHGTVARTRVLHFNRWQIAGAAAALLAAVVLLSGTVYHFVFLKAARDGWPVVSALVRWVVRDELAERERFMRDNLEAMAQRVGEFEARLVRLQSMGERVSTLAGIRPEDLRPEPAPEAAPDTAPAAARGSSPGPPPAPAAAPAAAPPDARGGPYVPAGPAAALLNGLQQRLHALDERAAMHVDLFMLAESRLSEERLLTLLVPTSAPVVAPFGSGFGFRSDPFTGRPALHTGLDFPAPVGTPIHAAAGGVVVVREVHPAYGKLLEIDHGNGLVTRYAHCDSFEVELGALVRRGDLIATVGNTGRSTGPHLHFEVLLDGAPQNPARFLAGRVPAAVATPTAMAPVPAPPARGRPRLRPRAP
jgi:murein DD-endopeptidase MepM/ murein hydrolase activator NlpD